MKRTPNLHQQGLTLIELMIAMALGLLLMLGILQIFFSNLTVFRTTENMVAVQDNARVGFELLTRQIREAGTNPCGAMIVVDALIPPVAPASSPGAIFTTPIRGYDGSAPGNIVTVGANTTNCVAGTDAILTVSGAANENAIIVEHQVNAAQFKVSSGKHGLKSNDIAMVCNNKGIASIFQITSASINNTTIVHNNGTGAPGNCTKGLGYRDPATPPTCTKPLTYLEDFTGGTFVVAQKVFWYIGVNDRGGSSLFRFLPDSKAFEELVENVRDMQITYLTKNLTTNALNTAYVSANSIGTTDADWTSVAPAGPVVAIHVDLELETRENIDRTKEEAQKIKRHMYSTIQIRSRESI